MLVTRAKQVFLSVLCAQCLSISLTAQAQKAHVQNTTQKTRLARPTVRTQPAFSQTTASTSATASSNQSSSLTAPAAKSAWDLEMDAGQAVWNTVGKRATANGGWDAAEYDRAMAEVEQHYRKALELSKHGSLIDQSRGWYQMARVLFFQKHYAESFDYYMQALNLRKKADPADTLEVGDIYEQLAMCKGMGQDNQASYDYSLKAYRIYSHFLPRDDNKFQYIVRVLGQYCSSPAEAIAYKRQEADATKKNYPQYPGLIACSVFMVAIEQGNAGLLDEAIATANEAASYAQMEPRDTYGKFIAQNIQHWQRQKAGLEAPWDVIYEPRYAGRRPRVKKVENPNPPTVAMIGGSGSHASGPGLGDGEPQTPPLKPRRQYPTESPLSQSTANLPSDNHSPQAQSPDSAATSSPDNHGKKKTASSSGGHRYYFQGREVSEDEYQAVKLSNDACDFIRQHKFQQASDQLQKALGLAPDLSFAHANLGIAMSKLGLRKGAIEHLQRAIALEPDNAAPLGMLASTYQSSGQLEEAIATYNAYIAKFPNENDVPMVKSLSADLEKELEKQKKALSMPGQSEDNYLPFVTVQGKLRWAADHIPVKVFVSTERNVHGYRPEFADIMRQCFDDWTKAGGPAIKIVTSKKDSDIDCYFTDNFADVSSPAEGGEAQMRFREQSFTHCTVVIMTVHATDSLDLTNGEMRAVCLHEIGHSMGLHGHSPRPEDIMFCSIPDTELKRPELTARDGNTMKLIYRQ